MSDIDEIITYRSEEHPNLLWLEVKTKDGVTGLGETFFAAEALEAYIHSNLAPIVLGLPSEDIGMVHLKSRPYVGFVGAGLELRARSALDIALWDILGKSSNLPVSVILGGRIRNKIPVYNTCAGNRYVRGPKVGSTENFGLDKQQSNDDYDDLNSFLNDPIGLAASLLDMGINSMKIWPFDYAAESTQGQYISPSELKKALKQSGASLVTMGVKRIVGNSLNHGRSWFDEILSSGVPILPNTAGCKTAREAVKVAEIACELFETNRIKLEVVRNDYRLQPDPCAFCPATKILIKFNQIFSFQMITVFDRRIIFYK